MNYEQKYNEALERASNELKQDLHESGIWAIKRIFPELTESEDERIKKEILDYIKVNYHWANKEELEQRRRFIAYLEKQKEQKPEEGDNETEIQKAFREGKSAGRKEVFDHPEYYGLQLRRMYDYETGEKNPEWSEEDETFVKDAIEAVENYYSKGCGQEELVTWLKSLRPDSYKNCNSRWKPSKEQINALNSIILNGSFTYVGQVQDLISLKDDLKKLM